VGSPCLFRGDIAGDSRELAAANRDVGLVHVVARWTHDARVLDEQVVTGFLAKTLHEPRPVARDTDEVVPQPGPPEYPLAMARGPDPLRVYWRPGCSSCVKVKEFLAALGIEYESVNVAAMPRAMEELAAMGVRTVPVVARGGEYVFAQELADVARFVGREVGFDRLPAPELMQKWRTVLAAARRHVLQIPPARLAERATEGRDRSIRELAYHVFQVPDAFLRAVTEGNEDLAAVYNAPPPEEVRTPADIGGFGLKVARRLEQWWAAQADKSCPGTVKTYYGEQPLHHLLERCVWHSAQHARQIGAVLERFGIRPDGPLTDSDYEGLPMPRGLWE
jgi:glutaredoxin